MNIPNYRQNDGFLENYFKIVDAKSVEIKVPEYFGECSCGSEIRSSDILKTLLSLS